MVISKIIFNEDLNGDLEFDLRVDLQYYFKVNLFFLMETNIFYTVNRKRAKFYDQICTKVMWPDDLHGFSRGLLNSSEGLDGGSALTLK